MLLAELEVWHSRPFAPTRRVALGHLVLPVEPAPGFGGLLLGAIVAANIDGVDPELHPDLHRLVNEVDRGMRIVQPRLRHRFQVDRVGLGRSRHRMVGEGEGESVAFELDGHGTPLQNILGAVYATERLPGQARHAVAAVLHKSMNWRGPIGPALLAHLTGMSGAISSSTMALANPIGWALDVLGFPPGTTKPSRREVTKQFRAMLREAHPDHGGSESEAARRIADLTEARRILT